jgi:hypothetical protein
MVILQSSGAAQTAQREDDSNTPEWSVSQRGSAMNGRGTVDAAPQHVQASYPSRFPAERKREERWAGREV